jgi:hypothetical protein
MTMSNYKFTMARRVSAELFPDINFGTASEAGNGACAEPIGRRGLSCRRSSRPKRRTLVQRLTELYQLLQRQHCELLTELHSLRHQQRNERETLPAILRRLTEIERMLRLTELHVPVRHSRRRPLG